MNFFFIKVRKTEEHIKILYKLLAERKYNISHDEMPSFESHKEFVYSEPYREWFLIKIDNKFLGSFYIQDDNSISIKINSTYYSKAIKNIINFIKENYLPSPPLNRRFLKTLHYYSF